ncbi:Flavonoid 3'-monooxygenase [Linum perenne]
MEQHNLWSQWSSDDLKLIVAATLVAASIMGLWLLKRANKEALPPGPRGLPIVGYLPFLSTHLHKSFTELAEVYGPVYKLWLGYKMYVVIGSPLLVKQIRDQDVTFAARDPSIAAKILTHGGNDIGFTSYGSDWKKLRKVFVRELLSNARLDGSYVLRKQEVERAVKDVYLKRGKALDFGQLVFMVITNTVLSMLWGSTIHGEEGEMFFSNIKKLAGEQMVLIAAPNISDFVPALARFDFQGIEKKSRKMQQEFDRILDSIINERRKLVSDLGGEFKDGKDFLQILLDLNSHEDSASAITDSQLKGLLLDTMIGGTDTTATTIEWTMAMLMQHQEAMQKVCKELDEIVGRTNMVEELHLPQLHYLDAVIKETSRLHPTLPLLVPRCPSEDCKLGGYTIPKGVTVFINAYAIHRDPQLWTNPLEFIPERFLDENAAKFDYLGNGAQYFPFGTGRRVCAGLPLAEKMLKYVLASLLHSFEWRQAQGTQVDMTDKFGLVVKLEKPLMLVPTPKLSNPELY